MLFPSWILHDVKPYEGEGERITVAFNCWFSTERRAAARADDSLRRSSPEVRAGTCRAAHAIAVLLHVFDLRAQLGLRDALEAWGCCCRSRLMRLQKTISPSLRSFTKPFPASMSIASISAATSASVTVLPVVALSARPRNRGLVGGRRLRSRAGRQHHSHDTHHQSLVRHVESSLSVRRQRCVSRRRCTRPGRACTSHCCACGHEAHPCSPPGCATATSVMHCIVGMVLPMTFSRLQ